jgi:hypothetical protein
MVVVIERRRNDCGMDRMGVMCLLMMVGGFNFNFWFGAAQHQQVKHLVMSFLSES